MKYITAQTIILSVLFLFLSLIPSSVFADDFVGTTNVQVDAFIDIDPYSLVEVDNENTEVGLWRNIRVRIRDRNGTPLVNREVRLHSEPSLNTEFIQPTVTDNDGWALGSFRSSAPGVYTIKAKDVTFSTDINVQHSAAVYVFPVPSPDINPEPYYTKGSTNTITWDAVQGLDTQYKYRVEVSTVSTFTTIVSTSPLITNLSYTFTGLDDSKMYFYRVLAQNSGGADSAWSDTVFSVQDSSAPIIIPTQQPTIDKSSNVPSITFKFNVTDNLSLKEVKLYCVTSNGNEECGSLQSTGSSYTAYISFSSLERGLFKKYNGKYEFCVTAQDQAGNVSERCDFSIVLDDYIDIDVPIFTEVINYVFKNVNNFVADIDSSVADYLSGLKVLSLTLLGLLLLLISTSFSLFILLGSISLIPYLVVNTFYRFLNFIGFRKHGAPCGVVYDSVTKKPLGLVRVKIYNNNNVLIRKDITNSKGEFFGNLDIGRYRVIIDRRGYLFPSLVVKKDVDEKYSRVYRGDMIIVSKRNPMNISIPLDPVDMMSNDLRKRYRKMKVVHFIKHLNILITVIGLLLALHAFDRDVSWFNLFILLLYIPAFGFYLKAVLRLNIGMK